jgi:hypothetical protein
MHASYKSLTIYLSFDYKYSNSPMHVILVEPATKTAERPARCEDRERCS